MKGIFIYTFIAEGISTNTVITADITNLYVGRKDITEIDRFFRHLTIYLPNPAKYIIF